MRLFAYFNIMLKYTMHVYYTCNYNVLQCTTHIEIGFNFNECHLLQQLKIQKKILKVSWRNIIHCNIDCYRLSWLRCNQVHRVMLILLLRKRWWFIIDEPKCCCCCCLSPEQVFSNASSNIVRWIIFQKAKIVNKLFWIFSSSFFDLCIILTKK